MKARIFADENRKWWTLGALSFALFMIMLDNTVVNVALPSIQRDLGIGLTELEWTVNAYALTFAVLMLTGGKLADFFGRKRVFLIGLVAFTLSSLICGLATSGETLIGARTAQGVGAALMLPATLSIISATFPPHQRGMAIGIWAGVSAMALAIGPLIGGLITEHIDWSWIFFVNVPIGVLGLVVGWFVIRESRDTSADQRLDIPGLLASGISLFALTFALIEANSYGWTDPLIIGLFVVSAVSMASFILLELHQRSPMLDLSLFRSSTFAGANVVALLVTLAMFGVFFFMSIYMQNVLGYSATKTGAAFLPMTILIILIAPIAGKSSDRIGSRALMTAGMLCLSASLVIFSRLGLDSTFWDILPGAGRRRVRHGARDDADDGGRARLRAGGEVGSRLRRPQHLPPGGRRARDRRHGSDRGLVRGSRRGPARSVRVHRRLPGRAPRQRRLRPDRRRGRICDRPQAPAPGRGRARRSGRVDSLPAELGLR